jgi:ParB/RepB/Spo0J family partition protein
MRIRTGTGGPALTGRAAELAKHDNSVAQVGSVLEREIKTDEFADVRKIPVASMRPDPEQPRELRITMDMLLDPSTVTDARTKSRVDSIVGLAATITEIGQQTSVEVYRDGAHYNIVSGERRYWAGRLAKLETLYAKVLPERPKRLRLKQYIENAQRDELDTRETLKALQSIIAESAAIGEAIKSWSDLRKVTGMSNATGSRWWAVLSGPDDVRSAILDERISSITAAEAIARTGDEAERAALIEKLSTAEKEGRATEVLRETSNRKAPELEHIEPARKPAVGRPKKVVFGGTPNLKVARTILKRLLGSEPRGIDWSDPEAISAAFKAAIQQLEEELEVISGAVPKLGQQQKAKKAKAG